MFLNEDYFNDLENVADAGSFEENNSLGDYALLFNA